MKLMVTKGGMFTTVQDLGRWGRQSDGVTVAGAMDIEALRFGNAMIGNDSNAAALEVTILGPEIVADGEGPAVFAGAELGFSVNGREIGSWRVVCLNAGDIISFRRGNSPAPGCRGYLCFGGGIDVPVVMGSRSTHTRAKIGGYMGRALKAGDVLTTGEPHILWRRTAGFTLPGDLRPDYSPEKKLGIVCCLQEEAFTKEGIDTLFSGEYSISADSDRMGARFEGQKIKHCECGADIVSDAIPLGAVQVPGHGTPIAMLADRQTTGGYTKIGVLTPASIQSLVQRLPGAKVSFERVTVERAVAELRATNEAVSKIERLRAQAVSAPELDWAEPDDAAVRIRRLRMTVDGKSYDVTCEEID